MKISTITEHAPLKVKISEISFDQENPNQMTDEQMNGLREAMKRFGYLQPIIIDQNNKIADGEHRLLVYKEFGMEEIPAYRINFENDNERRLLRQTMNKIRGTHDIGLDLQEINLLMKYDEIGLKDMLQINEETIKELQKLSKVPTRDEWNEMLSDETNYGAEGLTDIHTVQLIFNNTEFELFNKTMDEIKPFKENANTSQKTIKLCNEWWMMKQLYGDNPPPPSSNPEQSLDQ